jgi:hypothetical protein
LLHTKSVLKHGTKVTASCSVPQRSRCGVLLRRDLSVALSAANAEPRHLCESEHAMRAACRGAQEMDTRDDGAAQANTLICMWPYKAMTIQRLRKHMQCQLNAVRTDLLWHWKMPEPEPESRR